MQEKGWRTLTVRSGEKLRADKGNLEILNDNGLLQSVPICQLNSCVIENRSVTLSVPLLQELAEAGVSLVICDEKHAPCCELLGIGEHTETAGHMMDQAEWEKENKERVWAAVIRQKIRMQISLLEMEKLAVPEVMEACLDSMDGENCDRCEGLAARLYFPALFGNGFIRHTSDQENALLDYGYSIIRSNLDRILFSYGYHTALGIHHCSRNNRFNLSCDLMEPFRPFVDRIVFENPTMELDWSGRKTLLTVMNTPCRYGDRGMNLQTVQELFVLDVVKALENPEHKIKEVCFG